MKHSTIYISMCVLMVASFLSGCTLFPAAPKETSIIIIAPVANRTGNMAFDSYLDMLRDELVFSMHAATQFRIITSVRLESEMAKLSYTAASLETTGELAKLAFNVGARYIVYPQIDTFIDQVSEPDRLSFSDDKPVMYRLRAVLVDIATGTIVAAGASVVTAVPPISRERSEGAKGVLEADLASSSGTGSFYERLVQGISGLAESLSVDFARIGSGTDK